MIRKRNENPLFWKHECQDEGKTKTQQNRVVRDGEKIKPGPGFDLPVTVLVLVCSLSVGHTRAQRRATSQRKMKRTAA